MWVRYISVVFMFPTRWLRWIKNYSFWPHFVYFFLCFWDLNTVIILVKHEIVYLLVNTNALQIGPIQSTLHCWIRKWNKCNIFVCFKPKTLATLDIKYIKSWGISEIKRYWVSTSRAQLGSNTCLWVIYILQQSLTYKTSRDSCALVHSCIRCQ